jgi:hypothetical protein
MITIEQIKSSALITDNAKQWAIDNIAYLNKPMKFFGSSTKVEKGAEKRDTYIMYLQPAGKVSTATLCAAAATSGCEAPCLISSGQLGMTTGQSAATKRTILMLLAPDYFRTRILAEIDRAELKAIKSGIPALFRLNGTSDCDFSEIIAARPNSAFYDYTKILSRIRGNKLENYHLTFSGSMFSAQSKSALSKAIDRGNNVVVAFNTKNLPDEALRIPAELVDFDETDLRPLDAAGSLGALKRKGSNKAQRAAETDKSFFVTADNYNEALQILRIA